LHAKSKALCQLLIKLVEAKNSGHGVRLFGSRDVDNRGSHVSFHCPEGYAVMQALIALGVIGDSACPMSSALASRRSNELCRNLGCGGHPDPHP
jgi:kynureninase